MKILDWNPQPLSVLSFRQAESGGRVGTALLEITTGFIDDLPDALEGLIVTSDLQGIGFDGHLLGELAAQEVANLCEAGLLPPANKLGVLLCGDFYASPELQRGVSGLVDAVWQAFQRRFRWVVGVSGNHDCFEQKPESLLHGLIAEKDDLKVGGLGGVLGETGRGLQTSMREYERLLKNIMQQAPDILLLHAAPQLNEGGCLGDVALRHFLEKHRAPLTFCGHCHWPYPLQQLNAHTQICNVDGRVLVLLKSNSRQFR
ncbi:MAG TPA: metallophosphoesterase [Abditibacteriaceae bacterium]